MYRILWIASGVVPVAPIFLSRNFGQQPAEYLILLGVAYMAWLCAYSLPFGLHITRTVLYIQKKHKVKLKLAYKDPKDVIIV